VWSKRRARLRASTSRFCAYGSSSSPSVPAARASLRLLHGLLSQGVVFAPWYWPEAAAAAAAAAFVRRGKSTPSSGRLPDGVEAGVGDGVSSQAGRGKSRVHFGEAAQLGSGSAASVVRALLSLGGTELERRTVIVDMADDGVSPLAGDASQQQQRRHNDDRGATEQLQAVVSEAMRSSFGAVTLCTVWPHHEGVRTALVTFEAEQAALQCLEQPQTAAIQTLRERGWTAQAVPAKGSKSWTKLLSAHQI
jgi:hypothetical protein